MNTYNVYTYVTVGRIRARYDHGGRVCSGRPIFYKYQSVEFLPVPLVWSLAKNSCHQSALNQRTEVNVCTSWLHRGNNDVRPLLKKFARVG